MAIPSLNDLMLPILMLASDSKEKAARNIKEPLAIQFHLTDEERTRRMSNGIHTVFGNRVDWALTYLRQTNLIRSTKRGFFVITERGLKALKQNPTKIDLDFLKQYPELNEFQHRSKVKEATLDDVNDEKAISEKTPEEMIEQGFKLIQEDLKTSLLESIKRSSPAFFEKLVVDLLVTMGYGGTVKEAGKAVGKTGDEGIDGIIKEDILGLDVIYLQAKKWNGVVGRPEIQKFAGALQGHRAKKGIFITTGSFSNEAFEYVTKIDNKIVLIDGNQLGQYMIDNNLGVSPIKPYEIKKINSDYFDEE